MGNSGGNTTQVNSGAVILCTPTWLQKVSDGTYSGPSAQTRRNVVDEGIQGDEPTPAPQPTRRGRVKSQPTDLGEIVFTCRQTKDVPQTEITYTPADPLASSQLLKNPSSHQFAWGDSTNPLRANSVEAVVNLLNSVRKEIEWPPEAAFKTRCVQIAAKLLTDGIESSEAMQLRAVEGSPISETFSVAKLLAMVASNDHNGVIRTTKQLETGLAVGLERVMGPSSKAGPPPEPTVLAA